MSIGQDPFKKFDPNATIPIGKRMEEGKKKPTIDFDDTVPGEIVEAEKVYKKEKEQAALEELEEKLKNLPTNLGDIEEPKTEEANRLREELEKALGGKTPDHPAN